MVPDPKKPEGVRVMLYNVQTVARDKPLVFAADVTDTTINYSITDFSRPIPSDVKLVKVQYDNNHMYDGSAADTEAMRARREYEKGREYNGVLDALSISDGSPFIEAGAAPEDAQAFVGAINGLRVDRVDPGYDDAEDFWKL